MRIVDHPYLAGVKCREDGAVFVPASGVHKGHWTFGHALPSGYRQVTVARKGLLAHRLICEAFHGPCPEDKCQVDHINRVKDDNRPENLRWCTVSENNLNKKAHEASVAKYGVVPSDDENTYKRVRYANDPGYREKVKARNRAYYTKKRGV